MSDIGITNFESIKFQALERFLDTLSILERTSDQEMEEVHELQYTFLERCDAVLQQTIRPFLSMDRLAGICDEAFRSGLVACVDRFDMGLSSDEDSLETLLADCIDLLEELEDASEAWLSVAVLEMDRLKALYEELNRFSDFGESFSLDQKLQSLFEELIERSLLLNGEEKSRFQLRLSHGGPQDIMSLLKRFLQAHLEYGKVLQEEFLNRYPEVVARVESDLMQEAEKGLN